MVKAKICHIPTFNKNWLNKLPLYNTAQAFCQSFPKLHNRNQEITHQLFPRDTIVSVLHMKLKTLFKFSFQPFNKRLY